MESTTEKNKVLVKLDDGEDMFESLRSALESQGVTNGCVIFGIGQLKDFELGFFDGRKYHRQTYRGPHELVSLQGTVSLDSNPSMHLHASLSGDDMVIVGGHLFKAKVATVNEICVERFDTIELRRELDVTTGLKKLSLKHCSS